MRPLPLLALALLAGCGHDQNMTIAPAPAHRPVVTSVDHPIDLAITTAGLAPGEAPRLAGFLAGLGVGRGDRVVTNAEGPARDAIARVVAAQGLLLGGDSGPPAQYGAAVRVVVSRATASVSGCPDWQGGQRASAAATSGNFGCATNANLAAMIADPADLVRGRDNGGASEADVAVKAIKSWRDAKPTGEGGLKSDSTAGASGSGQGGGSGQ
ncbi:CpaD family pilus assembly lipoprotein [Sphingomonas quercus]|uniref:CpaD family pilus assembly protein n=1 Tax=Sphingomonas quercus TaxID=2842451 RepID=A0ABS6BL41_9SPHN|nr:CpaD family pilus assembly lipoprotein [Sphingomonas quercus]MBU3079028.1 CpaD family pilus assembly protein [Sphingomonas quercus]